MKAIVLSPPYVSIMYQNTFAIFFPITSVSRPTSRGVRAPCLPRCRKTGQFQSEMESYER
jgi:hypothetical protein